MSAWIVTLANLALLVAVVAPRAARSRAWEIVRALRPVHFLANLPVIATVLFASALLYQVPGLSWGWWRALGGSGGNVALSGLDGPAGLWLMLPTVVVLAVALPLLAETEEKMFRERTKGWWPSGVVRSVVFGLFHVTAGIPISAALALTLAGLWFTWQWMRGDTERSTLYHTAWNYTVVAAAGVLIVTLAVTS